jgi:similar to spore coat protein
MFNEVQDLTGFSYGSVFEANYAARRTDIDPTAAGAWYTAIQSHGIGDENMNIILEHLTGMNALTDQVIAMDLLITAKSGVRNYAMAITEAATPEIKAVLSKQLDEAINLHEQMTMYMIERGLYHPWNVNEQIQLDLLNIQTALNVPS